MNIVDALFGTPPGSREAIDTPPRNARLVPVRPKASPAVRAWRAESDCVVETAHGALRARGGADYIVAHAPDDHAVVRGDIFEDTYEPLGGGLFRKRTDITLHYFTLNRRAIVQTLEGPQTADAGDWIMQGVNGELWPVKSDKAAEKYEPL